MTLNENVINYIVLDLIILYNFDIKFNFIRDFFFFVCGTICRDGSCYHSLLKMPPFVGMREAMTRPYK